MTKIQGAKVWWRWVNYSSEPWAKLWHMKYARDRPIPQLIRFNESPNGSPIWLKALAVRTIIQEHSFWEIRDGSRAKFWEDSWNQLPILGRDSQWALIKQQELERGTIMVNQPWSLGFQMDHHLWNFPEKPDFTSEEDWEAFQEELNKRFIKAQEGPDIL